MEQQLNAYYQFIKQRLITLTKTPNNRQIHMVIKLHLAQIIAFQHERLIHLLVTLFFAGLLLVFILCSFLWAIWQFLALDIILIGLLACYIKHYFCLENTNQKLYPITAQLFDLLASTLSIQKDN